MTSTAKNTNPAPEAPLSWTSKNEWGSVGRTHYATVTLDNGDTWNFTVDSLRKGQWAARGWLNGDMKFYRDGRTMKDMKSQCQAHANYAATQTCVTCREVGGHKLDCAAVLPVPAPVVLVDEGAEVLAKTKAYADRYGVRPDSVQPILTVADLAAVAAQLTGRSVRAAVARLRENHLTLKAGGWTFEQPCGCPSPVHRMSCGTGARPTVVVRRPSCERCHGKGVDPEHVATEDYGDTTREVPVPCQGCLDVTDGVPDHLYHESCPGICCGGNEEL